MKTKEFQELKSESVEKLTEKVTELKKQILKDSMHALGSTPTNLKANLLKKRDVARLLTLISEKNRSK